jgi:hypothetical protein
VESSHEHGTPIFGFHTKRGISLLAQRLLDSHELIYSMELSRRIFLRSNESESQLFQWPILLPE